MAILRTLAAAAAVCLALVPAVSANDLPTPGADPILTVTGSLTTTNVGDAAVFDMEMLRGMDPVSFETSTPWTEGVDEYTGVSLQAFMELLGVTGGSIKATAINDYAIEIPVSDAVEGGPIIAYLRNGETMSVRDKGPLWVIYPYDDNDAYQTEVIYSRSIWQLDRLEIMQ